MCVLKANQSIRTMLDLVAACEGTSSSPITKNDGYDIIVSGVDGPHRFDDYTTHPFSHDRQPINVRKEPWPLWSSASGRYQFIFPTWKRLDEQLHLNSFMALEQDMAAMELLRQCGAIKQLRGGLMEAAVLCAGHIWASMPGSNAGQGGRSMDWVKAKWDELWRLNA